MALLPHDLDYARYWGEVYKQPLAFWQPALAAVAAAHQLPGDGWERAALGRNVVFVNPTTVIKFGPPCWPGEMAREAAALRFVAGRLPVATPTLVAAGALGGWEYLVQDRLPGTNLWQLWGDLGPADRARLATQHGRLMAALHALPLDGAPAALEFDWQAMFGWQHAGCAREMRAAGVDAALAEQVQPYLAAAPWAVEEGPPVLLHGDLTHLNFLVADRGGGLEITGLIDWGDAKIGRRAHEFLSPGVHMYKGDAQALLAWYRGYGWGGERAAQYQHVIMARAMLYYPEDFAQLIASVQGAARCTSWEAMAEAFWHMAPALGDTIA